MSELEKDNSSVTESEKTESVAGTDKSQANDNLKYRLEREREKGAKQILNELGISSVDEIKEIYKKLEETTANYEKSQKIADKAKSAEQKLEVLKNGFDEKFVDFIVHELGETEDFAESLTKFKSENPQYLKNQSTGIKISTAPNFEKKNETNDFSKVFNEAILKRLYKE